MKITFKFKEGVEDMMLRLGEDVAGGKRAGMTTVMEDMVAAIDPEIPTVTSNLRNQKAINISLDGDRGELVYTQEYGLFVNEGTGIFGPSGKPITPKKAKALKTPYGPRKSVKGMEGRHFVEKGMAKLDPAASYERGMGNYLKSKGW